jgi:hypothetical protein
MIMNHLTKLVKRWSKSCEVSIKSIYYYIEKGKKKNLIINGPRFINAIQVFPFKIYKTYNNDDMLRMDKISKNIKIYNTFFDKNKESENEKQHKEDNENLGDPKSSMTSNAYSGKICTRGEIKNGLLDNVGCSVTISGLRRMKQTYYQVTTYEGIKVNLWLVWVENWQKNKINKSTKVLKRGCIVCDWGRNTRIRKGVNYSKKPAYLHKFLKCQFHDVKVKMKKGILKFNYMHRWLGYC